MTLVKKQYNGRELPVFENVDQAREYFARRRKTIYKGINALLLVFGVILGIIVVLFHPSLFRALVSVILFAVGGLYCIIDEPKIRAPKEFGEIYSEEEEKWLLFPADEYPAVAFVLESEYDTMKEDYTMDDHVIDATDRFLKKNTVANRVFVAGIFLSAILLPIAPVLSNVSAIVCWLFSISNSR